MPVSTVSLSILSTCHCVNHATEVTITTNDRILIQCLMKSHNQLKEIFKITQFILEIFFHIDIFESWSYKSELSMSIDFVDLLYGISSISSHIQVRFCGGAWCMFQGI